MKFAKYIISVKLYRRSFISFASSIMILFLLASCKKLVDIDPPLTQPSTSMVYANSATAASVLTGVYSSLSGNGVASGLGGISALGGLSADELTVYIGGAGSALSAAYTNSLNSRDVPFWTILYNYIYTSNTVLENLAISTKISSEAKNQLNGEAKFIRAFCYFYLVNFFGDVPLILSTDYKKNAVASRTESKLVWQQIIADLKDAQGLLNENYMEADVITSKSTTQRVRPNKWTASALLARAYLYTKDYVKAEIVSDSIVSHTSLYNLESDLNNVFLIGSRESIWQLQSNNIGYNTFDGYSFILTATPDYYNPVALSPQLLASFETGDKRATDWIGSLDDGTDTYYYANKYKVKLSQTYSENLTVFRLAEQYLIRAEARINQSGKVAEGIQDLNLVRNRARAIPSVGVPDPLPPLSTNLSQADAITAVAHERQIELFTEWAHRWLDLKRTATVDAVMSVVTPQKGGNWSSNWQWYPIPYLTAISTDPNISQNAGY